MATARLTTAEFFPMFEPPLKYGNGWDAGADKANARVAVLSQQTNEKAFGGENSVGRKIKIGDDEFTVVGVLADWHPTPKFYDVTAGPFAEPEDVVLPFRYGIERELRSSQNNSCWKDAGAGYAALLESDCIWLNFWVELESAGDRARYKAFLDAYVNEQKKLGRFPRPLNNRLSTVGEWLTLQHVVRNDTHIQVALSFGFLVVCMINTLGLLLAKFMGRANEIGLRRALGASKRTLFAQFLTEAGLVGVCGGVAGLAITWLGLAGVRCLYDGFERLANLDWMMVVTAIGLAICAALLAGIVPTWRACRIAPATYLKTN
jgi:putative ABC transport system permease protein